MENTVIVERFQDICHRFSHKVALIDGKKQYTYKLIDEYSDRIARVLSAPSHTQAQVIGVYANRSWELVVAMLGILKAGKAYLLLSPEYPAERLSYMLTEAACDTVLYRAADRNNKAGLTLGTQHTYDIAGLDHHANADLIESPASSMACVLFTSGSTGKPKGICLTQANIHHLVVGQSYVILDETVIMGFGSNVSFDITTFDVWGSLLHGATLVVIPHHVLLDPECLGSLLATHHVNHLFLSTAVLGHLILKKGMAFPTVKTLLTGGEALSSRLATQIFAIHPQLHLINMYGPAECTMASTYLTLHSADDILGNVDPLPIGYPIQGVELMVLQPGTSTSVLPGDTGELCIAGQGVATAYLGQTDPDDSPFFDWQAEGELKRYYRTGDLVYQDKTGCYHFVGRIDEQFKINGVRIEPSEITHALCCYEDIEEAIVLKGERGSCALDTYYTTHSAKPISPDVLRPWLLERLPRAFIPHTLTHVLAFPLTPNGKIDKKALPEPDLIVASDKQAVTSTQQQLLAIWQHIFKRDAIGMDDNFFSLGGDSITAMDMAAKAAHEQLFFHGTDLFLYPTLEKLSAFCEEKKESQPTDIQLYPTQRFAWLPIQQWFFDYQLPEINQFSQSFVFCLSADVSAAHLKCAFEHVLTHHKAFSLRFDRQQKEQYYGTKPHYQLTQHDMRAWPSTQIEASLAQHYTAATTQLEVTESLWVVVNHFQLPTKQRVQITVHHLIIDGISWRVLVQDINQVLSALLAKKTAVLPDYQDYSLWGQALLQYAQHIPQDTINRYQRQLEKIKHCLTQSPQWHTVSTERAQCHDVLSQTVTTALFSQALKAKGSHINGLLLGALYHAFSDIFSTTHLPVVMESHGREALDSPVTCTQTMGWFTALYPVLLMSEQQGALSSVHEAISLAQKTLDAIPKRGFDYFPLRYLTDNPLDHAAFDAIPVKFNYLGHFPSDETAPMQLLQQNYLGTFSEKNPLTHLLDIECAVIQGQFHCTVFYASDVFDQQAVHDLLQRFMGNLVSLIHWAAAQSNPGSQQDYPLLPIQRGILFHSLITPEHYLNQVTLKLKGQYLCGDKIQRAVERLIAAFDVFHAKPIHLNSAEPQWRFEPPQQQSCMMIDVSMDKADAESLLTPVVDIARVQSQLMENQYPYAFVCAKRSSTDYDLIWINHHVLFDGSSIQEVIAFIQQALDHYTAPPAQINSYPYKKYLRYRHRVIEADSHADFWQDYCASMDCTPLDFQRLSPELQDDAGQGALSHYFPASLSQALVQFTRAHGVTSNSVLQCVWGLLLNYYQGQNQSVFGMISLDRPDDRTHDRPFCGLAIHSLPIGFSPKDEQDFVAVVRAHQATLAHVMAHKTTPLMRILQQQGYQQDLQLFQTLFVHEHYETSLSLTGDTCLNDFTIEEGNHYPITGLLRDLPSDQCLQLLFDKSKLSTRTMAHWGQRYLALLTQLISEHRPINQLTYLLEKEEGQLNQWSQAHHTYKEPHHLVPLLQMQVSARPTAEALVDDHSHYTFAEMGHVMETWGSYFRRHIAGQNKPVAILMSRSADFVLTIVSLLSAGHAYLPLDPEWPKQRVQSLLDDENLATVLTTRDFSDIVEGADIDVLYKDDWSNYEKERSAVLESLIYRETDLAYVIFTSGSTGRPKGVMVEHKAICNRLHWQQKQFALQPGETVLFKTPATFDVSVWEIFWPLINGGRLAVAKHDGHRAPFYLQSTIKNHGVDYIHFVPSMMEIFLDALPTQSTFPLKLVCCSGEALKQSFVDRFYQCFPSTPLYNLYGPTETAIEVGYFYCQPESTLANTPIGHPIDNVQLHVLNAQLHPVGIGEVGELCIAGVALARGYLGQSVLTKARFIYTVLNGHRQRLYRTGDLAYWNQAGQLIYMGRVDDQIKIHGVRIELDEIKHALQSIDGVSHAEIIVLDKNGVQKLVACYTLNVSSTLDHTIVRKALNDVLPSALVPSDYLQLDQFPVTVHGKLDRKALHPLARMHLTHELISKPSTHCQHAHQGFLAFIANELCLPDLTLETSLGSLYLSSLQSVQLLHHLNQYYHRQVTLQTYYTWQTLGDIYHSLQLTLPTPSACIHTIHDSGHKVPLVLVHSVGGTIFSYQAMKSYWDRERPLYGIADPGVDCGEALFDSIEAMAVHYLAQLMEIIPDGRFILGGHSLGATLAVEMSRQLGTKYDYPVLLLDGWANYADEIATKIHVKRYITWYQEQLTQIAKDSQQAIPPFCLKVHEQRSNLLIDYHHQPITHPVWLFKAEETLPILTQHCDDNHWGAYANKLTIHWVPGDHNTMLFEPQLPILTTLLIQVLDFNLEEQTIPPAKEALLC